jgi:hypothetical protein
MRKERDSLPPPDSETPSTPIPLQHWQPQQQAEVSSPITIPYNDLHSTPLDTTLAPHESECEILKSQIPKFNVTERKVHTIRRFGDRTRHVDFG